MTDSTILETAVQPAGNKVWEHSKTGLGLLVAAAALAYYLFTFHEEAAVRFGCLIAAALVAGGAIGMAAGRLPDVLFWTVIGVGYGYLAVIHADLYDWTAEYAWPFVGGIVGAVATLGKDGQIGRRMVRCALVALCLVAAYEFTKFGFRTELLPDLYCATIGGALMGVGVDLVRRVEKAAALPRYGLAVALMAAAMACHWMAIRSIPGL